MHGLVVRFDAADVDGDLPDPGYYESVVVQAELTQSRRGNTMMKVIFEIAGAPAGRDRVTEYFVLDGSSARGRAVSRRQLVELYRACGVEPRAGAAIDPHDLVGGELEIKVEHEDWEGGRCLKVTAHRSRPLDAERH